MHIQESLYLSESIATENIRDSKRSAPSFVEKIISELPAIDRTLSLFLSRYRPVSCKTPSCNELLCKAVAISEHSSLNRALDSRRA